MVCMSYVLVLGLNSIHLLASFKITFLLETSVCTYDVATYVAYIAVGAVSWTKVTSRHQEKTGCPNIRGKKGQDLADIHTENT